MTGYTVHTGSTKKFSQGWDRIFKKAAGGKAAGGKSAGAKSGRKASAKRKK